MPWWLSVISFIVVFLILAGSFGFTNALACAIIGTILWFVIPPMWDGISNFFSGGSMDAVAGFFLAFAFIFSGAWIWLWFGMYLLLGGCFWYDDKIPNGIWLTIGATVLWFVLWPNSWGSFREHMFQLFVYAIPSYLGLGVVWSFYKFSMTMREMRDQIVQARTRNGDTKFQLENYYPASVFLSKDQVEAGDYIPKLTKGGGRNKLINWILFWPWSVFNYIFGKLLHDLLNLIVDAFSNVYHNIAKVILKDLTGLSQKP